MGPVPVQSSIDVPPTPLRVSSQMTACSSSLSLSDLFAVPCWHKNSAETQNGNTTI
jgi:hypothetical protein